MSLVSLPYHISKLVSTTVKESKLFSSFPKLSILNLIINSAIWTGEDEYIHFFLSYFCPFLSITTLLANNNNQSLYIFTCDLIRCLDLQKNIFPLASKTSLNRCLYPSTEYTSDQLSIDPNLFFNQDLFKWPNIASFTPPKSCQR